MDALKVENEQLQRRLQEAAAECERVKEEEQKGKEECERLRATCRLLELEVLDHKENEEAKGMQKEYLLQMLEEKEREIRALNEMIL